MNRTVDFAALFGSIDPVYLWVPGLMIALWALAVMALMLFLKGSR